jgi:CRISPR-associated protein Cas1
LCEAAILAAGYAPAIGFLHRGKPQSFVYDIADLYKFETVVPVAFSIAARLQKGQGDQSPPERQVRIACRDVFRKTGLLEKIIPEIEEILLAGGLNPPDPAEDAPEAADPALPRVEASGDDGHRH